MVYFMHGCGRISGLVPSVSRWISYAVAVALTIAGTILTVFAQSTVWRAEGVFLLLVAVLLLAVKALRGDSKVERLENEHEALRDDLAEARSWADQAHEKIRVTAGSVDARFARNEEMFSNSSAGQEGLLLSKVSGLLSAPSTEVILQPTDEEERPETETDSPDC